MTVVGWSVVVGARVGCIKLGKAVSRPGRVSGTGVSGDGREAWCALAGSVGQWSDSGSQITVERYTG